MVKMKAIEALHISETGPHTIQPGETFEVSEADATSLAERGLARRAEAKPKPKKDAGAAPANKNAGAAPANKAAAPKPPIAAGK